jgi:molecular chaperone GrpE
MNEEQDNQGLEIEGQAGKETPSASEGLSVQPEVTQEAEIEETPVAVDVDVLTQELQEARARADEYLDGWQRARADFANFKKRVDRDQAQVYQMAAGNIIRRYLDVADDLERALKKRPQDGDGSAWAVGIELIYRKIMNILENEGVIAMEVEGQFFDPNLHEAVAQEESKDHESGQIIEVVQAGYKLGDRVLRPAKVRIAK